MPDWNADAPLERIVGTHDDPGEPGVANDALRDYYALGSGRSLATLCDVYNSRDDPGEVMIALWQSRGPKPPTRTLRTLEKWSPRWDWVKRVAAQTAIDEARRKARFEAMLDQVVENALDDYEKMRAAWLEKVKAFMTDAKDMKSTTAARLDMDLLARTALGLPARYGASEITGQGGAPIPIALHGMSEDELDDIIEAGSDSD